MGAWRHRAGRTQLVVAGWSCGPSRRHRRPGARRRDAGIGRFLVGQQQPDGSIFDSWRSGAPVPAYGLYSTGEAAWSLALLERVFPGEGWGEAAGLTLDYMATRRDRVEGRLSRLPDHWAAYTVAELPRGC